MEDRNREYTQNDASIHFSCEGRCRICPFPGANCAKKELKNKGEKDA